MLIAEFSLSTPLLRDALAAAPGTTVELEHSTGGPPSRLSILARSTDLNRFEDALTYDDSIRSTTVRARNGSLGQYELVLSTTARDRAPPITDVAENVEPLDGVADNRGWEFRVRFADRAALIAYRDRCRTRDISFTLHDLYVREAGEAVDAGPDATRLTGEMATDD